MKIERRSLLKRNSGRDCNVPEGGKSWGYKVVSMGRHDFRCYNTSARLSVIPLLMEYIHARISSPSLNRLIVCAFPEKPAHWPLVGCF